MSLLYVKRKSHCGQIYNLDRITAIVPFAEIESIILYCTEHDSFTISFSTEYADIEDESVIESYLDDIIWMIANSPKNQGCLILKPDNTKSCRFSVTTQMSN